MAIGLYYGGRLVADGDMKPGNVLSVFFAVLIAALGLGQTSQLTPDFAKSSGAASAIFDMIDRKPQMHLDGAAEFRQDQFKGKIRFRKISFCYPTRPDITVMKDFSLSIKQGQHVAFVGPSGSGKSTVTQLLQRFYEPSTGSITIDGVDIQGACLQSSVPLRVTRLIWFLSDYDLQSLRRGIGVVNQEPTLFVGSIADNIKYANPTASDEDMIAAAKMANAHEFILELGHKYNTQVGERGAQLSGGQKQRIAIARAILKDPRILILDEATSALDAESEHLVQQALDNLMKGRTTIVIAHRLTTVRNVDMICVLKHGVIAEKGSHEKLLKKNGVYASLVSRQLNHQTPDAVLPDVILDI
jgi:ABC-type multidrug transport system fused ATPase/permease subunit